MYRHWQLPILFLHILVQCVGVLAHVFRVGVASLVVLEGLSRTLSRSPACLCFVVVYVLISMSVSIRCTLFAPSRQPWYSVFLWAWYSIVVACGCTWVFGMHVYLNCTNQTLIEYYKSGHDRAVAQKNKQVLASGVERDIATVGCVAFCHGQHNLGMVSFAGIVNLVFPYQVYRSPYDLGSWRANWVAVFGSSIWWFLPVTFHPPPPVSTSEADKHG